MCVNTPQVLQVTHLKLRLSQKKPYECGFLSSSPSPFLPFSLSPLNPSTFLPYSFSPRLPHLVIPPSCQTSHFDPLSYSFHVAVGLMSAFSGLPQARSLMLSLIHSTNICGVCSAPGACWGYYEEHSVEVMTKEQDSQQGEDAE